MHEVTGSSPVVPTRSSFLSVSKYQSLVGVFNRTFAGLFSLYIITTERKVYQRNDRYCYGTIGFLMNFIKKNKILEFSLLSDKVYATK